MPLDVSHIIVGGVRDLKERASRRWCWWWWAMEEPDLRSADTGFHLRVGPARAEKLSSGNRNQQWAHALSRLKRQAFDEQGNVQGMALTALPA